MTGRHLLFEAAWFDAFRDLAATDRTTARRVMGAVNALARDPHIAVESAVLHQPENENMTLLTYPSALPSRPRRSSCRRAKTL